MERKTIELFTHQGAPAWWTELQELNSLDSEWVVSPDFLPRASVIMIPREELPRVRRGELSFSKAYIIVDHGWTGQNLKRALQTVKGALFMDVGDGVPELSKVVQVALTRQLEKDRNSRLMQTTRLQNRQIEELNRGLEQVVLDRTVNETDSRKASQKNVAKVREIIGFIKELTQLFDIADLLPAIRRQLKEYHSLDTPLLFVPRGEAFGDLYYLRGSQTIRTRVRGEWVASPRIRVNEPSDSLFLANAMGRPFGKVIRFPLVTVRHQKDVSRSPLLMFEHRLTAKDLDPLVSALSEKLQPVSWALDRLVLEQELKSASRDWEMTFDELSEPIAILDHDGRVLRANSHWRDEFKGVLQTSGDTFRVGQRLYAVERYPIRMSLEDPPLSWVVYLRDETRSQRLKSQVVQVEKMSAIGHLAGHIAHKLNNPLTGIRSLTQVLLTETPPDGQVHQDLSEVERASARCQGIINNLLDFSKGGLEQKVQVMDLNEIARKTLPFLKSATGRFRSDIQFSQEELPVKVEPHLMQQVIFNLVNNACQAMSEKGEIAVHTRRNKSWALLEVRDTGPGINAELLEKIFEPFFTTKKEGEGTGLGLSLSRDFVRQFGGDLECESNQGEGAVFRVRLPLEADA
ncbi:MAG TPA: ATP-binding protein [Bdellovibrionales bacterium]|nr:ATP-binding protein [Bdellovibrionales bacterium]